MLRQFPLLESLSVTTWVSTFSSLLPYFPLSFHRKKGEYSLKPQPSTLLQENPTSDTSSYAPLPSLRSLHLDSKSHLVPTSITPLWSAILRHLAISHAPLTSLTLQLSEAYTLPGSIITEIVSAFARTLKSVKLVHAHLSVEDLKRLCIYCEELEHLQIPVPLRHLVCLPYFLFSLCSIILL